jgi:UDP-N-acetylmuramate dehydrogenase
MPQSFASSFQYEVNLAPFNTLGIEARAQALISVSSRPELQKALEEIQANNLPIFVLGGGSNVLFVHDYPGCVLRIGIKGHEVVKEDNHHVWLRIGAGEIWHSTVLYCIENGWGGIENLSLIPGTVGAAPIQNIGAYGVELEQVFANLEAVETVTGATKTFAKSECGFGYRNSVFKNHLKGKYVITHVTLRLCKHPELNTSYGAIRSELEKCGIDQPTIKDVSDVVIAIRNSKLPDPSVLGNAGSFFKNPVISTGIYDKLKKTYPDIPGYPVSDHEVKVPAGWLIDQAGWKGKRVGKTGTYKQQALVIVNHGGATGEEILDLARQIQASVAGRFGIELVPEVNIVG